MHFLIPFLVRLTPVVAEITPLKLHSSSISPSQSPTLSSFFSSEICRQYDYVVLSKPEITSNSFNSLNITDLSSLNIQNELLVVPDDFKPVFLFNEESPSFSFDGDNNATDYLLNSPPFNIPRYNSYDLGLFVPKSHYIDADLKVERINPFVVERIPLLVFSLNDEVEVAAAAAAATSAHDSGPFNVQDILEFDALTKNWLLDLPMEKLIEGFFCNMSNEICVKINLNEGNIIIFSIWESREISLPLSILLNDNLRPRSESYTQLMQDYESLESKAESSSMDKAKRNGHSFDDLKYKLVHKLKQNKMKSSDEKVPLNSQLISSDSPNVRKGSIYDKSRQMKSSSISGFNSFQKREDQVELYKTNKIRNAVNRIKLLSTKVNKTKDDRKIQAPSETNDCEPITWFNVFHHSIFNDVKFCV